MGRAELRRAEREKRKSETVTYNLTRAQLDAFVQEQRLRLKLLIKQ